MKKLSYLIVLALILGLVLTGCSLLSNIGQVPSTEQKGMPSSTANLVALWHFDENSGSIAYDSTVNSKDGMIYGATNWVNGKLGKALSFNGTNNYVNCGDSTDFEFSGDFSVEVWVKHSVNSNQVYVSKWTGAGSDSQWWLGFYNNKACFGVYTTESTPDWRLAWGTDITDGEWHHVVGVRSGTDIHIYQDGAWKGSGAPDSVNIAGNNAAPLTIGNFNGSSGWWWFNGDIDEVRIWDGALKADEILYSYADNTLHVDDDWNQWPGAYRTINEALAVAVPDDTIIVEAGTYNENVTIDESVILQGGSGVILQGSGSGSGFLIKAADIIIDGFEIKNFAIGIRTYGGPSNFGNLTISNVNNHNNSQNGVLIVNDTFDTVTIEDCQINLNNQNGIGIANTATIGTLQISNTQVSQNGGHGLFLANTTITNLSIVDSNFDGSQTDGYCGITFGTTASNIGALSMTGGSLSGNKGGGLYVIQAPSQFVSILLNGVEIYDNLESGIMFGGSALTGVLTVENCLLQGNGWEHIDLSGGWFGKFSVTGNTFITGNTFNPGPWCALYIGGLGVFDGEVAVNQNDFLTGSWGINNNTSKEVDATCNWWGDNSGPRGAGPGTGDVVSVNVDYNPWLLTTDSSLVYTGTPQPVNSVVLEATLFDSGLIGISGMDIEFYLDGYDCVGTATTGNDGVAKFELVDIEVAVGVYEVYASTICSLKIKSDTGYLAVYDPSAGFVTGGGWIDSPAGAYTPELSLSGKATFGFVSKYKKGQSTPTGNTEFQFKAGNLNFHSDSYDWLIIAGYRAKYKGTGTINGAGNYGFMLFAIDDEPDMFRIKIWDKDDGDKPVYDNKIGEDEGEDFTATAIGGGQIVIHKGK